ncbi:MAG: hypothetical protein LUH22_15775 [Bacteroides sp.]|nr:hypothetical protein [Bacteroides sp.]
MRDRINKGSVIAEENVNLTGHPAKEKFGEWSTSLSDKTDIDTLNDQPETPETCAERRHKIDQMEQVIEEDIERTKE